MNKLGIVTVLYNSDNVIYKFLDCLLLQNFQNYILYIVDNSFNETSNNNLKNYISQIGLIDKIVFVINNQNIGVAKGNNLGIKLAIKQDCDFILLANNDIEFYQQDIFLKMTELCKNNKVIAPKILYFDSKKIWYAGGKIDKYRCLPIHYNLLKPDFKGQEKNVTYAPTCFVMFDKEIFTDVGLMDESYFVYWDDVDFMYRLCQKGYNIFYTPEFIIYHKVSSSTGGKQSEFSIYNFLRYRIYFIKKNLQGFEYLSSISYTIATSIIKLVIFKYKRKKIIFKALKTSLLLKQN